MYGSVVDIDHVDGDAIWETPDRRFYFQFSHSDAPTWEDAIEYLRRDRTSIHDGTTREAEDFIASVKQTFTKHEWYTPEYYEAIRECRHCGVYVYSSLNTETCEEYAAAKAVTELREKREYLPEERAWAKVRSVLSRGEWAMLGFERTHNRTHRDIDRI